MVPDYAFDREGNLFGLAFNGNRGRIYRYNVGSFSPRGMTVTPVLDISGPILTAGRANYGFAWHAGAWYAGNSKGTLYRIDPYSGASSIAGRVTTPAIFNSRLADLASAQLVPSPELELTNTVDRSTAQPGDIVRFQITARNPGYVPSEADFTNEFTHVLDEADYLGDVVADRGTVKVTGQQLMWQGRLKPGATAKVSFAVRVKAPPLPRYQLISRVTSHLKTAVISGPVTVDLSGFELSKSVDKTIAVPGDTVTYTVTGRNAGRTPLFAEFTDNLRDVRSGAIFRGDLDASSGRALSDSGSVRWQGRLPQRGDAVTVTYSVVVSAEGVGRLLRNAARSSTAGNTEVPEVTTAIIPRPEQQTSPDQPEQQTSQASVTPAYPKENGLLASTGMSTDVVLPAALVQLTLGAFLIAIAGIVGARRKAAGLVPPDHEEGQA